MQHSGIPGKKQSLRFATSQVHALLKPQLKISKSENVALVHTV